VTVLGVEPITDTARAAAVRLRALDDLERAYACWQEAQGEQRELVLDAADARRQAAHKVSQLARQGQARLAMVRQQAPGVNARERTWRVRVEAMAEALGVTPDPASWLRLRVQLELLAARG
jgi:hypothetical protein